MGVRPLGFLEKDEVLRCDPLVGFSAAGHRQPWYEEHLVAVRLPFRLISQHE